MTKIAILIAAGFEEIEAITPIDILRRAGIQVVTLGIGCRKVIGSHNIVFECDHTIEDFQDQVDGVVIPGGMPGALNISESVKSMELINNLYLEDKLVAAICASPGVVLGKTKILNERDFTCYPSFESSVEKGVYTLENVVVSGNVITSRGPGTAMEFALKIVSYLLNEDKASIISKALLFPKTF